MSFTLQNQITNNADANPPVKQPEESLALKKINKCLMQGKQDGIHLLKQFLEDCSDGIFSENCVKWLQWCCKVEGKSRSDVNQCLEMFSTLLKLSKKFPELGRPIANSASSRFIDVFAKNLTGIQIGWETLEVLMICYNNSLASSKETLDGLLNEALESAVPISPQKARCFALLPSLGGGGTGGMNHKTNWRQQIDRLILTCHSILKILLRDAVELLTYETQEITLSNESSENLTIRLGNACSVIQSMLLGQYPSEKSVPAQGLFDLVRRVILVVDEKKIEVLPKIHKIMLETLSALIVGCERALLPFSTVMVKLLDQSLQFSAKLPHLRVDAYSTLCNWMVVTKTGSCIDRIAKSLLSALLSDIQTKRNVVILRGKGKKKKNEATRSKLPVMFYEPRCYAALKTLDILFNSIGFMLPTEIHKDAQLVVIETLLSIRKQGAMTPLYGESDRCRAALYQVLLQLTLEPCSRWPPPTQFALKLLRYGQDDASPQVSSVCLAALTMVDRIIHPEFSVAAFPIDYKEVIKDMERLVETETQDTEETAPDSPLSVVDLDQDESTQEMENGCADETVSTVELNGDTQEPIEEVMIISEERKPKDDMETPKRSFNSDTEDHHVPHCQKFSTDTNSSDEPTSEPVMAVAEENPDDKKISINRKRTFDSSDSDSSPSRREHPYNLRPKTPKSGPFNSPIVQVSKSRRIDLDNSPRKILLKTTESADCEDITVLFDETIIN